MVMQEQREMNPLDTISTVSLCCRQLEHWMKYKSKVVKKIIINLEPPLLLLS